MKNIQEFMTYFWSLERIHLAPFFFHSEHSYDLPCFDLKLKQKIPNYLIIFLPPCYTKHIWNNSLFLNRFTPSSPIPVKD
jgi:hypothetical protein